MSSLFPEPVRAEINNAGTLARCRLIADQAMRMRCIEQATSKAAQGTTPAAPSIDTRMGSWRLVRTPNPRGGPDAISIMQTADPSRSDIDLAGLMLRCGEANFDVLIVFIKPFLPRALPKVKLTTRSSTVEFRATVISPGAAISLPSEAAALVHGPWQSSPEVTLEITENENAIRGVIPLAGLARALALLMSNCASR
jgi:hypothetical protein